jgi:cytochrome c peroxidase
MRIGLGYVKGLSKSFVSMVGEMALNLQSGSYGVTLNGLTAGATYSVWLVDQSDVDLVPPLPDTVVKLATILALGPSGFLSGQLPILPLGFTIDRVVIAPGTVGGTEPLAAGSVNVFQKIFFRRLTLLNESTGAILFEETTLPPALFALVPDLSTETELLGPPLLSVAALDATSSSSSPGQSVKLDKLISQGAALFFEETFNGNGRTCGTCHPASNNFTIDPDFIKTLPANDPLFVAEFNPALAQLERPELMKKFGLILENLDGFSDPTSKFVMRGVPHTLGLQVTLTRDRSLPSPPAEMTGWSGDGAPVTGALRDFAIGAVTQHFTKDLARVEGRDFTLPRERQLDAMEAFQLSLGRDSDFDLSELTFTNEDVNTGKSLFMNGTGNPLAGGSCGFCHTNAGARSDFFQNENRNFNTNVEDRAHPARSLEDFPKDGGFGRTAIGDGTFGNGTFNTPSVVEAADTSPFFHNNVEGALLEDPLEDPLENAVRFYIGPEFNNPAVRPPSAQFSFTDTQIDQLVAFLRGLNTLQNIDVARRELAEILAIAGNPRKEQDTRLQTAFEDTQDAIDVLSEGNLFPNAVTELTAARNLIAQAQHSDDSNQRRTLIQEAIATLDRARNAVAITP